MYKCKHCGMEFDNKYKMFGHSTYCKQNPNRNSNLEKLSKNRNNIIYCNKYKHLHLHCQYCNKEIANKGCLVLHERSCYLNPINIGKKQNSIKTTNKCRKHTEESKQKIREGLKKWREENKEKFLAYSKGKSIVCENFKQYLKNNNINFIEEYCPYPNERLYSLDIAWPDEKIAIEINGSQHYDSKGNLNEYTLEKQKFFEDHGWKIIQIYYRWCYSILKYKDKISSIFDLPIHNKEYVKEIYKRDFISKLKQEQKIIERETKMIEKYNREKKIIYNLLYNSNIDFSKYGWSGKAKEYLKNRNELWSKHIFQMIKKYAPDFLKQDWVFKRKNSIY